MILDEEQRFGVAQKELLKSLRLEVDVLTLSATPIPRTLHMSLAGMRDISIIETPPEGRRPIRTTVGEYDEELVKLALEREPAREGQAFFLHNRVETIEERASSCSSSAPGSASSSLTARCGSRELEERMHAFLARRCRRARLDDDHRVGHRHPAGEHADRRARRHARARPALPDPRTCRPLRRDGPRLPLLSRRARADARGAGAAGDARRPHRARRRLRDRDARPRDPRRRRAARRRAVGPRRRASASSSTSRCSTRPSPSCRASAGRGAAGAGGRARRRLRPRRATSPRRRSRSTCTAGSRSSRTRTSCASSRSRSRTATGRCRSPSRTSSAIQQAKLEARAARRRLPRLPGRQGDRRPARARLGRAARAARPRDDRRLHLRQAGGDARAARGIRPGGRARRCYLGRSPGGLRVAAPRGCSRVIDLTGWT